MNSEIIPNDLMQSIARDISKAYGSTDAPRFSFAETRYRKNHYSALISELAQTYDLSETTDLNDDVCVALVLSHHKKQWALDLSLVGNFALFGRILPNNTIQVLTSQSPQLDSNEDSILETLRRNEVKALPQEVLRQEISFRMRGEQSTQSSYPLFEVVFSRSAVPFA